MQRSPSGTKRSHLLKAVALSFTLTLLAGCSAADSSNSGSEQAEASESEWTTSAASLWSISETLISEPRVAGSVAIAYVAGDANNEFIVAWDAESGEERWRHEAVPGTEAPGVSHSVVLAEQDSTPTTAFLAPSSGELKYTWGHLTVVDVETGESVAPALSSSEIWSSRPVECLDTFCVNGKFQADDATNLLLYNSANGGTLGIATGEDVPYIEDGRFLGHYVSSSAGSGGEKLSYGENGQITWSRPYTDVFGEGSTSDGGWNWADEDKDIPLVGLGWRFTSVDQSQPFEIVRDLNQDGRLVGLDRETGETLWHHNGVLPCMATSSIEQAQGVLVLCRANSGVQTISSDGVFDPITTYSNVSADLIGLDAQTGDILWDLELEENPFNNEESADGFAPFVVNDAPVITKDGRALVIDPANGETSAVPDDAVLLCSQRAEGPTLTGAWNQGVPYMYEAAALELPCSAQGAIRETGEVSRGALMAAGYEVSEVVVLNFDGKVTALDARG